MAIDKAMGKLVADIKACGWRACPRAEKNKRSVCGPFPDLLRALLLRRLLMERRTMFARSRTAESDVLQEAVGFKGERHAPSYRSVPPLDARRLPTFN